ncbi:GAF domain-containing protein [Bradyrhizobium elkanii]|uniref:GAF domain-containing protein n=1 Tax=Bradyrhizobium elkanii TaxID=29448 RepID=UPI0009B7CB6E
MHRSRWCAISAGAGVGALHDVDYFPSRVQALAWPGSGVALAVLPCPAIHRRSLEVFRAWPFGAMLPPIDFLGGVWSEEVEGTNGIGTCIVDERPVTVHRSQHFRSRHINLSCSGAPVFGVDGRLIAVLDVSAIDPELSERAHALTGALTVRSAHAIEERYFREQFLREWIVAVAPPAGGGAGMLLAIDGNQRIVGANRVAARVPHAR